MFSKGVSPESTVSYPKPSEKAAVVREEWRKGEGREKFVSLSQEKKVLK